MELIMFLNEQKEGEKSTHQMIKKHEHRKQNRAILKLPKTYKKQNDETKSDDYDSDGSVDADRNSLINSTRNKRSINHGLHINNNESASTNSHGTQSFSSSQITSLSRLRAQTNQYEVQQENQMQRVKRNQGGNIELELAHAKTSELLDDEDDNNENENKELTEADIKQKERERERK